MSLPACVVREGRTSTGQQYTPAKPCCIAPIRRQSRHTVSLVSDLIRQTFMMLLVLVLYKLLKPVNKNIALLMVIFALVGIPMVMLNELDHFAALLLSSGADYLTAFEADQLQAQVMFFLDLHEYGTFIPQVFSFWLLLQGYLVFKSGFLPRILGILLMIGGLCYPIHAVLFFLFPNQSKFSTQIQILPQIIRLPTVCGPCPGKSGPGDLLGRHNLLDHAKLGLVLLIGFV